MSRIVIAADGLYKRDVFSRFLTFTGRNSGGGALTGHQDFPIRLLLSPLMESRLVQLQ